MKAEVLRRAFGTEPFTASEAADVWGIRNPASTLNRLKESGVIMRVARGVYKITPDDVVTGITQRLERNRIEELRRRRDAELPMLARRRWRSWLEAGYIRELGDKWYRVTPRTGGAARVRRL